MFRSPWFYLTVFAALCASVAGYWFLRARNGNSTAHETYTRTVSGRSAGGPSSVSDQAQARQRLQDWAKTAINSIEKNVHDYSAVFVKRERSGGTLSADQAMFIKVRQKPFSVYMHFLSPEGRKGEEAIYVEGRNNGNLLGHTPFLPGSLVGTVSLSPTGFIAMQGQRHSIQETGILKLTRLLLEAAQKYADSPACFVRFLPDAKINDRPCTCIEAELPHPTAKHPQGRALARIFVDKQLDMPVRYEQYDWSGDTIDKPQLMEQYTYLELKLNNAFTDADFDVRNPNYGFP